MNVRRLGQSGPDISVIAYGLMSLSQTYGPSEDAESLETIHAALDSGINFLDTAEVYGMGHNERLFSQVLEKRRNDVVVATKFGLEYENGEMRANGRPKNVRRAIEGSLDRLGIDTVDLYYLHRLDPNVPIEETVGTMARLVDEGKVRYLGLSEVNSDSLRRASKEHPIAALQSEYSVFQRIPEDDVLKTCRELDTTFVAFSPLGRGLLTGTVRGTDDLSPNDVRHHSPQLEATNLEHNLQVIDEFGRLAKELEIEPGQLALAWTLAQGVVPLFGTRRAARVRTNCQAINVEMDAILLERIEEIAPAGAILGTGISEAMEKLKQR